MALAAEAATQGLGLVRAAALVEPADLAPEVGDIRVAVQEVAGLGLAAVEAGAPVLAREAGQGQGQAGERPLGTAEPRNGFLPHRCYMARPLAEDRGAAHLAVLAANMPSQKMTSARC